MQSKNPNAVSLGKLGGKKKASNMTPEERTAHAKKMVEAREAKKLKATEARKNKDV